MQLRLIAFAGKLGQRQAIPRMKNALVITSLVVIISYPIAIVAETIGVVPFSVRSLPAFAGLCTAAGILALAFTDYFRQPRFRAPPCPTDNRSAAHLLTLTSASARTNCSESGSARSSSEPSDSE